MSDHHLVSSDDVTRRHESFQERLPVSASGISCRGRSFVLRDTACLPRAGAQWVYENTVWWLSVVSSGGGTGALAVEGRDLCLQSRPGRESGALGGVVFFLVTLDLLY